MDTTAFDKNSSNICAQELVEEENSENEGSVELSDNDTGIFDHYLKVLLHEDKIEENESRDDSTGPSTSSNVSSFICTTQKQCEDTTPWIVIDKEQSVKKMPEYGGQLPVSINVREPIEYFRDFFDFEILDHIVEESNLYAIQKNSTKPLILDKNELERFFGTLFLMNMMNISNTRLYWSTDFAFKFNAISKNFSRNRWQFIKTCFRCNNDNNMLTKDDQNYDPLFIVRPLLTHLQNKFNYFSMPQMMCVDKQITPLKGKSQLKQYIPSKNVEDIKFGDMKYYHKLIFHFLEVSVVNSWLLYKRDCDNLHIPSNERLNLQHFKLSVTNCLLLEGKSNPEKLKAGKTSQSLEQVYSLKKKHGNRTKPIPEASIRKDGLHHWPHMGGKQNRCKVPGCGFKTCVQCTKCNTYLCLTKERNCFRKFHT